MGHTKEPWKVVNRGDNECNDIDAKGPDGWPGDVTVAMNIGKANARRIVDCVNACAGIPDQILTAVGAFGGFGRDHMVNHVTKQREDLLAALEKQVADVKHCQQVMLNEVGIGFLDVVTLANSESAIASVKGACLSQNAESETQASLTITEETQTTAPAIVFYPAGSLGEAVESEWGEA